MSTLYINNVTVVSPNICRPDAAIVIVDDKITAIHNRDENKPQGATVIEGKGCYALPGFIDIHSHGADQKDVCDNDIASIEHIAQRKLQEGVTTWVPTTLTQPREKLTSILATCQQYYQQQKHTRMLGVHVEGPFINVAKAGAQNPEFVRPASKEEFKQYREICPISLISLAPEVAGAEELINYATQCQVVSSAAHSEADYQTMKQAMLQGLSHLTHFGNAMTGLHHREIGMVGTGLLEKGLKIELICDGIHLAKDFLKLVFATKDINDILLITDSMAGSWIDNGNCQLGGLDVVVADGVARLKEGGALAGSTLKFNEGLAIAKEVSGLPLKQLIATTSWNQAQSLGYQQLGKITPGFLADITLLDNSYQVQTTIVNGIIKYQS